MPGRRQENTLSHSFSLRKHSDINSNHYLFYDLKRVQPDDNWGGEREGELLGERREGQCMEGQIWKLVDNC
jgi:hypothetical protein